MNRYCRHSEKQCVFIVFGRNTLKLTDGAVCYRLINSLTTNKQTTKFSSANFQKMLSPSYNYQKADNKIFVCKFSKNIKSKLYHIENSKTRGQTI